MSRSAAVAALESIDGVGRGGGADVRLETVTVYNVNGAVEQTGNVVFQSGVVENGDVRRRIKFKHDIDVAVGPVVAARTRAKQGRVTDATGAQGWLVFPKPGEDFLTIHPSKVTRKVVFVRGRRGAPASPGRACGGSLSRRRLRHPGFRRWRG